MMLKITRVSVLSLLDITCMLLVLICGAVGLPDDDDSRLSTKVSLAFASGTIAEVLSELSHQTGLKISPSDAVAQRRVTLYLKGVPAFRALDAIADLNDWRWSRTESGRYLVSRPSVRAPTSKSQIPRNMGQALPRDMRTYLGLNGWYDTDIKGRSAHSGQSSSLIASNSYRDELLRSINEALENERSVAYSDLTHQNRERLLFILFSSRIHIYSEVLYDEFAAHMMEPARTVLELDPAHRDVLMVNMHVPEIKGVTGFGTGLPRGN